MSEEFVFEKFFYLINCRRSFSFLVTVQKLAKIPLNVMTVDFV